jgi:plastocyanin
MHRVTPLILLAGCVISFGATPAMAQDGPPHHGMEPDGPPRNAQVVALDECDPITFNPAVGEEGTGFCHNVTLYGLGLGFETPLGSLIDQANSGTPDPGWDFEPDQLTIQKGTTVSVVDQGGEPHTFTEVSQFGGGFVPALNHGEAIAPECAGGFKNVAVARTRILQGSRLDVAGLSRGKHFFQCCIHPWMRMEVDVK